MRDDLHGMRPTAYYPLHIPVTFEPVTLRPGARVLADVARETGFAPEILRAPHRHRPIVHARQMAMYRLVVERGMGLAAVGRLLRRDHSTVGSGVRAHAKRNGLTLPAWMRP